jgi:membrane protease YdiL (CAAX protease family)
MFKGITAATATLEQSAGELLSISLPPRKELMLVAGAAVYEELLFRLILIGGGVFVLHRIFMWNNVFCALLLLLLSSALFSAAHHVGSPGNSIEASVFLFRTLCGLTLGAVFLARGLGIAVWTHALYNVLVLIQMHSG